MTRESYPKRETRYFQNRLARGKGSICQPFLEMKMERRFYFPSPSILGKGLKSVCLSILVTYLLDRLCGIESRQHHFLLTAMEHHNSQPPEQLSFVSINPADARGKTITRLVRSHAVKRGIAHKRRMERDSGDNFRVTTSAEVKLTGKTRPESQNIPLPCISFQFGQMDPLQKLAVTCSRLCGLLNDSKSLHLKFRPVEVGKFYLVDSLCR